MDWDFLLTLGVFILFVIMSERKGKKKPVPPRPPQQPLPRIPFPMGRPTQHPGGRNLGFEIPRIEGAPQGNPYAMPEAEEMPSQDSQRQVEYQAFLQPGAGTSQAKQARPLPVEPAVAQTSAENGTMHLTPETALQAVAWAEILGAPRARARRRR